MGTWQINTTPGHRPLYIPCAREAEARGEEGVSSGRVGLRLGWGALSMAECLSMLVSGWDWIPRWASMHILDVFWGRRGISLHGGPFCMSMQALTRRLGSPPPICTSHLSHAPSATPAPVPARSGPAASMRAPAYPTSVAVLGSWPG